MDNRRPPARAIALCLALTWCAITPQAACGDTTPTGKTDDDAKSHAQRPYVTETIRGRVVWLADALKQGFGVTTEPAAAESSVVVETADGKLWPVVPDTRGQAFVVDERLRDRELQLLVRRYDDVPMVQIIRVFEPRDDGLWEIDYWCDICAIPMYILKPCECCQGETRLRETRVERPVDGG